MNKDLSLINIIGECSIYLKKISNLVISSTLELNMVMEE